MALGSRFASKPGSNRVTQMLPSCELRFKDGQIADELVLVGRGSDALVFAEEMVFYESKDNVPKRAEKVG